MPSRNERRFYVKDRRSALLARSVLDVGSMVVQASTQLNGSKYLAHFGMFFGEFERPALSASAVCDNLSAEISACLHS